MEVLWSCRVRQRRTPRSCRRRSRGCPPAHAGDTRPDAGPAPTIHLGERRSGVLRPTSACERVIHSAAAAGPRTPSSRSRRSRDPADLAVSTSDVELACRRPPEVPYTLHRVGVSAATSRQCFFSRRPIRHDGRGGRGSAAAGTHIGLAELVVLAGRPLSSPHLQADPHALRRSNRSATVHDRDVRVRAAPRARTRLPDADLDRARRLPGFRVLQRARPVRYIKPVTSGPRGHLAGQRGPGSPASCSPPARLIGASEAVHLERNGPSAANQAQLRPASTIAAVFARGQRRIHARSGWDAVCSGRAARLQPRPTSSPNQIRRCATRT